MADKFIPDTAPLPTGVESAFFSYNATAGTARCLKSGKVFGFDATKGWQPAPTEEPKEAKK
jgi:hypothetical protein